MPDFPFLALHRFTGVLLVVAVGGALAAAGGTATPAAAQNDAQEEQRRALPFDPELPYCSSGAGGAKRSPMRAVLCSVGYTVGPIGGGVLLAYAGDRLSDSGSPATRLSRPLYGLGGALIISGLVVGPSTGSFYARDGDSARIGMAVRAAGGGVVVAAVTLTSLNTLGDLLLLQDPSYPDALSALLFGGLATVAGGTLFNFVAAPLAAYLRGGDTDAHLSIRPRLDPVRGRGGLAVRFTF
jgi:hypothetical protein